MNPQTHRRTLRGGAFRGTSRHLRTMFCNYGIKECYVDIVGFRIAVRRVL